MAETQHPIQHTTPVLVVGAGPVGLMTAYQLARLDVPCMLAEQALHTTKWPKMDLTSCRTMEILRIWGLAQAYRSLGVPSKYSFDSHFCTSLGPGGKKLSSWDLPSVDKWRKTIEENNDGSNPAEPGQRCSQIIFEAWMKENCIQEKLVDGYFGLKFISSTEDDEGVTSHLVDERGRAHIVRSQYLVGCDGGGSTVRKSAGIKMIGGPLPYVLYLVHFRSKELAKLRPNGRFWHVIFPTGGFVIDQDEKDTFTSHLPIHDLNTDVSKIDPREAAYECLGGTLAPFRFEIDEVLVHSAWRPNFCIAEKYMSDGGRALLAGDSAHRAPPHGGYGMNFGVEEAVDLGFKLAAAVKGYSGPLLLQSYGLERRPMMIRALEWSDRHVQEHVPWYTWAAESHGLINEDTPAGEAFRKKIHDYLTVSGSECTSRGVELDSRYRSPVIYQDRDGTKEHEWDYYKYVPSTRPGGRAPHVFLKDGKTSILDLYGKEWTLVEFTSSPASPSAIPIFTKVAAQRSIPLTPVHIKDEDHVRALWERNVVLVRPDGHVAWRNNIAPGTEAEVNDILDIVVGKKSFPGWVVQPWRHARFNSIIEAVNSAPEGDPKFLAAFQKDVN